MKKLYSDYYRRAPGDWTAAIYDSNGQTIAEEHGYPDLWAARSRARELLEELAAKPQESVK